MRVVITGMGAVSCLGVGLSNIARSLQSGSSGIGVDPERVQHGFRSPLSGLLPELNLRDYVTRRQLKTMGQPARWAVVAASEALDNAGLSHERWANPRSGVVVGNDSCALPAVETAASVIKHGETRYLGSGKVLQAMTSTVSMNLGTWLGVQGASWSVGAACASGAHALGQAFLLIKAGLQDRVLCGGAQEVNWQAMASFDALGAFARPREDPTTASRPFSADRDGLVPSGGAAMLVLESLDAARARNAPIVAELCGYGFSCDGAHLTQPDGAGALRAMTQCLQQGAISPGEVDYINAHATGTPLGDRSEGRAILSLFGPEGPPVSSTKSMTGHECWMAGASEVVYSCIMMQGGFLAPNINLGEMDSALTGLRVVRSTQEKRIKHFLSNSFGFGGTNASLLCAAFQG